MPFMEFYPRTTLYQYCSAEAFLGILQSKTLWYTDLAGANDPREIDLGYEHILEAIKSVSNESQREPPSRVRETQRGAISCSTRAASILLLLFVG